ncbi:nucleotide exchange factor GrpE [Spirillospora sp. CA-294931]|uniref:nucleotide exchange factor GrpE n=1 Tax=Spirillospora sp. CA-294931 TaxID=3240042 RepID=UPI003D8D43A4
MSSAQERPVSEGSTDSEETAEPPTRHAETAGATVAEAAARRPVWKDEVLAALGELAAQVKDEHDRAGHREAVIDRLHEENQRLRRGELQAMFEPVRNALYRLHDQARRQARKPADADPAALLSWFADEVADALARTGVERFAVEPGEPYDAARHRPVLVEEVDDPALAGTVVSVLAEGFEREGRVVRKAEVCVAKAAEKGPGAASEVREPGRSETMRRPSDEEHRAPARHPVGDE